MPIAKRKISYLFLIGSLLWVVPIHGGTDKRKLPRFEDYPVTEKVTRKTVIVKIQRPSERKFRTNLREAAKEAPNFAGHYRFVRWGCGSECLMGAVIDLRTGQVHTPPHGNDKNEQFRFSICQSSYAPSGAEFRLNSRLVIIRCGLNFIMRVNENVPDTYYYLWEGKGFRLLKHVHVPSDLKQ